MLTTLIVVITVITILVIGNFLIDYFFAMLEHKDTIARNKQEKLSLEEELEQLDNPIQIRG